MHNELYVACCRFPSLRPCSHLSYLQLHDNPHNFAHTSCTWNAIHCSCHAERRCAVATWCPPVQLTWLQLGKQCIACLKGRCTFFEWLLRWQSSETQNQPSVNQVLNRRGECHRSVWTKWFSKNLQALLPVIEKWTEMEQQSAYSLVLSRQRPVMKLLLPPDCCPPALNVGMDKHSPLYF